MEYMPGTTLKEKWRTLPMQKKSILVQRIAHCVAQLFRKRFQGLGNLYHIEDAQDVSTVGDRMELTRPQAFAVHRIVSM